MTKTLSRKQRTRYLSLFPDWTGSRPLDFFMLENLLEARAHSSFPTNFYVADEDVNVYLTHLLTNHVNDPVPQQTVGGCSPLFFPPEKATLSTHQRAEFYRKNADHRLLCLGLYDRGDLLRRKRTAYPIPHVESLQRDVDIGRHCYQLAINLLGQTGATHSGLLATLTKLEKHFADYVYVLQVLARTRLGLGARLSATALERLLADSPGVSPVIAAADCNPDPVNSMDELLDELSAYRHNPTPAQRRQLIVSAREQGIQPQKLLART